MINWAKNADGPNLTITHSATELAINSYNWSSKVVAVKVSLCRLDYTNIEQPTWISDHHRNDGHVIVICDLPCQLLTSKVNTDADRKLEVP